MADIEDDDLVTAEDVLADVHETLEKIDVALYVIGGVTKDLQSSAQHITGLRLGERVSRIEQVQRDVADECLSAAKIYVRYASGIDARLDVIEKHLNRRPWWRRIFTGVKNDG